MAATLFCVALGLNKAKTLCVLISTGICVSVRGCTLCDNAPGAMSQSNAKVKTSLTSFRLQEEKK